MEITPLRTDEEIEAYIKKNYGSVEAYQKNRLEDPPMAKSVTIAKSAAEVVSDSHLALAKSQNLSREQFYKRYPEAYQHYVELSYSRNY